MNTIAYSYIYKITNRTNNKCYIGQATNIVKRFSKYRTLRCIDQPKIYNALKKYGIDNFLFEVIDSAIDQSQADDFEVKYVQLYNSFLNGYNCNPGGFGRGRKPFTKEHIENLRIARRKRGPLTPETKQKISLSRMGQALSEETKHKISKSLSGDRNPMFNKHHSEETKHKISATKRISL